MTGYPNYVYTWGENGQLVHMILNDGRRHRSANCGVRIDKDWRKSIKPKPDVPRCEDCKVTSQ